MKWMGWSWRDLLECPEYLVNVTIPELMEEVKREQERPSA